MSNAVETLHKKALEKLQEIGDGFGRRGFAALVDAARYTAIVDVCQAIREDRRLEGSKRDG